MNVLRLAIFAAALLVIVPYQAMADTAYGHPLTLTQETKVSAIMARPDEYVGRQVQVSGLIVEVCAKRGCWMDIASDAQYETMQIKVTDGEIVFPMSARGKTALVEGVVDAIHLSAEQALEWQRHKAGEQGKPFDPTTVSGPQTIYRIIGQGAVIKD